MHEGDGVDAVAGNKCHLEKLSQIKSKILKLFKSFKNKFLKLLLSLYACSFAPQWLSYGHRRCSGGSCMSHAVVFLIEILVS